LQFIVNVNHGNSSDGSLISGENLKTTYKNHLGKTVTIIGNWKNNIPVGKHVLTYDGKTYSKVFGKTGTADDGIHFYFPFFWTKVEISNLWL
jgi:hypothetical protein